MHEEIVFLKGYDKKIRQLAVAALRKQGRSLGAASLSAGKDLILPALIITLARQAEQQAIQLVTDVEIRDV